MKTAGGVFLGGVFLAAALTLSLAGCNPGSVGQDSASTSAAGSGSSTTSSGSSSSPSTPTSASVDQNSPGFLAFKNGFYAYANTQGCVMCHGATVTPMFGASDVAQAYLNAKGMQLGSTTTPLIDFNSPTTSIIITFAGNSHCAAAPCSNPANSAAVEPLLVAWASAELSSSSVNPGGTGSSANGPQFLTMGMPIPPNLPTIKSAAPAILRFQLSQLNPAVASLANAIFEVQIELVNSTEYRVSNPRIGGNSAAVSVTGIHVFIKPSTANGIGSEDTSQGLAWTALTATAAIFQLPTPLPTRAISATPLNTTPLDIQVQSPSDIMTIGFDNLR